MFCSQCGKELADGVTKCPNCGKEIGSNSSINFSDITNYAGQQMNKAVAGAKAQVDAGREAYKKEQEEKGIKNVSELIVDSQKQQIAVMGSSYLDSLLHGGVLRKGFGILTDKRFYFKGKCFTKTFGRHAKIDQEYTVDLDNITASGFVYIQRYWLIVLAIVASIICVISFALSDPYSYISYESISMCALLVLVAAVVLYFLTRKVYYEVHFEGGMISVDVSKYGGIKEVRAFNKALCLEKDKCKSRG